MTRMKRLQTNLAVKFIAVVLAIVCGTMTLCGGVNVLRHWDSLFGRGYSDSGDYYNTLYAYRAQVATLLDYQVNTALYGANYLQKSEMEYLEETLAPENTNFRYVVRSNATGQIFQSNTGGVGLEEYPGLRPGGISSSLYTLYDGCTGSC